MCNQKVKYKWPKGIYIYSFIRISFFLFLNLIITHIMSLVAFGCLYCTFVSHQDPTPKDGQKNGTCRDQICKHFTIKLGPSFCLERLTQSLETKWVWSNTTLPSFLGISKSYLGVVQALYESITIPKDTLWKALELYVLKHAKGLCFTSIHTWLILQDVFCWAKISMMRQRKLHLWDTKLAS
jgi:hypothetical protein